MYESEILKEIFEYGKYAEALLLLMSFNNLIKNFKQKKLEKELRFNLAAKIYPGEVFESLGNAGEDQTRLHEVYDDILLEKKSLLLIISSTSNPSEDEYNARCISKLGEIHRNIISQHGSKQQTLQRIAVVFSKFDCPSVWNFRTNLNHFINSRFPRTKVALLEWGEATGIAIQYFPCSAFGVLDADSSSIKTPNVYDGDGIRPDMSALKDPQRWKPLGVFEPIYWLLTGKYHSNLFSDELFS